MFPEDLQPLLEIMALLEVAGTVPASDVLGCEVFE